MNEAHAAQVLAEYQEHYNRHRHTGPEISGHLTSKNNPAPSGASRLTGWCAPASSRESSTSTATPPELQRRLFEPHSHKPPSLSAPSCLDTLIVSNCKHKQSYGEMASTATPRLTSTLLDRSNERRAGSCNSYHHLYLCPSL
jgi:hypothetical protein